MSQKNEKHVQERNAKKAAHIGESEEGVLSACKKFNIKGCCYMLRGAWINALHRTTCQELGKSCWWTKRENKGGKMNGKLISLLLNLPQYCRKFLAVQMLLLKMSING